MKSKKAMVKGNKKRIKRWQVIAACLMLYDITVAILSYFTALWLRFDFHYSTIPAQYISALASFVPLYAVVCLLVFGAFRLYQSLWRFASYSELLRCMGASAVVGIFHTVAITLLFGFMPVSYYILGPVIQFSFTLFVRFSYRLVLILRGTHTVENQARISCLSAPETPDAWCSRIRSATKTSAALSSA